jgi:TolB-like protein/Tfp pilus assembly protein PilF
MDVARPDPGEEINGMVDDDRSQSASFLSELRRRNVLRVAAAYAVAAWLIIQVAETIFPLFGFDETPARVVVIALAIGFVPAMVFAWVFELTPEGLKREKDVDRTLSVTPNTGRRLDRLIMLVLAAGLAYFAFDHFVIDALRQAALEEQTATELEQARQEGRAEALTGAYGDRSIAVLPFADMSPSQDQEYLADGLAEELLNLLAGVTDLRVISRSSSFSFKGKDLPVPEIAERLNVAHVLEGSVRKSGNTIRITAQLIDARVDTHLWSKSWNRPLDNVFAIQDEIAAVVVEELRVTLMGAPPTIRTTDPDAYNLYLQARHLGRQGSGESMLRSNKLLDEVLAIDPRYVPALNGQSTNYVNLIGARVLTADEGYRKAREMIERALAIDPDNGVAYGHLAWYYEDYVGDVATAARHYERAMALAPGDSSVLSGVAVFLLSLGRLDESIALQQVLAARDPVNPITHHNLGIAYLNAGQFEAATTAFDKAVALSPEMVVARIFDGYMACINGDYEKGLAAMARLSDESGYDAYRLISLAFCYPKMGREAEGLAALRLLERNYGDDWARVIADIHAHQGRPDEAFEWLERAFEMTGPSSLIGATNDFMLEPLHDDPRWRPLLEQAGASPEQLAAIRFDVRLPD